MVMCPKWKSSLIVTLMISIIVHLPLRGCQLRCYFFNEYSGHLSVISGKNQGESLFQCGGFLYRQIGMEPLVTDWSKEEKMAKIVRNIHICC